jgi:hypothetical protein
MAVTKFPPALRRSPHNESEDWYTSYYIIKKRHFAPRIEVIDGCLSGYGWYSWSSTKEGHVKALDKC